MFSCRDIDAVDALDREICKAVQLWFEVNPQAREKDQYYHRRLAKGSLLGPVERAIADCVEQYYPKGSTVCEVGAGYGQLSILLAACGYHVLAFESDWRCEGARMVASCAPYSIDDRIEIIHGQYPAALDGRSFNVLVASNVVNSGWLAQVSNESGLRDALRGKPAIVDLRHWGKERTDEEIDALVKQFRSLRYMVTTNGLHIGHLRSLD